MPPHMRQRPINTTHSNTHFETVRIIRPHHPLFGKNFPLVRTWKFKRRRFYIIQLPDKSHIQIPVHWADEGKTPLPENICEQPVFRVDSIRELVVVITTLKNRGSTM